METQKGENDPKEGDCLVSNPLCPHYLDYLEALTAFLPHHLAVTMVGAEWALQLLVTTSVVVWTTSEVFGGGVSFIQLVHGLGWTWMLFGVSKPLASSLFGLLGGSDSLSSMVFSVQMFVHMVPFDCFWLLITVTEQKVQQ